MKRSTFGRLDAWCACYVANSTSPVAKLTQAFEFVTGAGLFEYQPYDQHGLDAAGGHLWQMMCFTGERFTPEQLQASTNASQYFDATTCLSLSSVFHLSSLTSGMQAG